MRHEKIAIFDLDGTLVETDADGESPVSISSDI